MILALGDPRECAQFTTVPLEVCVWLSFYRRRVRYRDEIVNSTYSCDDIILACEIRDIECALCSGLKLSYLVVIYFLRLGSF